MINFDNKESVKIFKEELIKAFISNGVQDAVIERKGKIESTLNTRSLKVHFQIVFTDLRKENEQNVKDELEAIFRKQRFDDIEIISSESTDKTNNWDIIAQFRKSKK